MNQEKFEEDAVVFNLLNYHYYIYSDNETDAACFGEFLL
jgi:hypothetical protein